MRNTKRAGQLRYMLYRTTTGYVACCIDLAIVREGKEPLALKNKIERLAQMYVINIARHNLSENLLNQNLPAKYMRKYKDCEKKIQGFLASSSSTAKANPAPAALTWEEDSVCQGHTGKRSLAIA